MEDRDFNDLFSEFRNQFVLTNPPPIMRGVAGLGWEFALSLIWAVFAVLMVSSQTASEFYQAKILSGMDDQLAFLASLTVLIAVEGGLVIGAAIKASGARAYNKKLVVAAIFLCVLISMVAGLNSSVGIIPNINPALLYYMRVGLVFALGMGGSLVAWASGEVLGSQIARLFVDREAAVDEHRQALAHYNEQLLASWRASPEYVLAKADVRDDAAAVRARRKLQPDETFHETGIETGAIFRTSDRPHYRKLSDAEKLVLLNMTTQDIMARYGVGLRTAQHWREFSRRDKANGDGR